MHTNLANEQLSFESILLDASAQFNLYEKRLLLLALDAVREIKTPSFENCSISTETSITVKASKYVEFFGGDIQSAYHELTLACNNIFSKEIPYPITSLSGRSHTIPSRWLNGMRFQNSEASIELIFPIFIRSKLKSLEESLNNSIND